MKQQPTIGLALLAFALGGSCLAAENPRTVAIHAGQMFDSKSERMASKQVIVIQGERIADVGPEGSVKIPPGAEEIDLGTATVLRIERSTDVMSGRYQTIDKIERALHDGGIRFTEGSAGYGGIEFTDPH